MHNFKWKYIQLLFYLSIIVVITSCNKKYEEVLDPCDNRNYTATGTNILTIMQSIGDTLLYINLEDVAEPSESFAYRYHYSSTNSDKTFIEFHYNTYESRDPEFYQVDPLFNGATSFVIRITLIDSTLSNHYEIDQLSINFKNGYYSRYEFINDTNTKLTISKYGEVFDKIEGDFVSILINTNNDSDSLSIQCQFSAVRWCDI